MRHTHMITYSPGEYVPHEEWNYNRRSTGAWVTLPYKPKSGLGSQITEIEVWALLKQTLPVHGWPHWLYWLPVEVHPKAYWYSFYVKRGGEVHAFCSMFLIPVLASALDKTTWHDWLFLCEASMVDKKVKYFQVDVSVSKMLTMQALSWVGVPEPE